MVYDVFAGVGPFAVPAGRKKCIVIANDLNPDSYKWLKHNFTLNKVKCEFHTHNLDGRQFIRTILRDDLVARCIKDESSSFAIHVVMNLPALAIEFLDAFPGILKDTSLSVEQCSNRTCPRVHCYCFSKSENPEQDVQERAKEHLGHAVQNCSVRAVRNVAPNKEMMCISFDLTWDMLFSSVTAGDPGEGNLIGH